MRRNLLIFTSTFPLSADDIRTPRFIYDLGRELTRYYNVFVLAPHAPGKAVEEVFDSMTVVRYRYFCPDSLQRLAYGAGMTFNLSTDPLARLQVPFFLAAQYMALGHAVRRFNIELVNSHWMAPQGLTAALRCRALGVRHVLTIHSAGLHLLRRLPMGRRLGRFIVRRSDALYCVSRNKQELLNDLIGRDAHSRVLPMGIDTGFYAEDVPRKDTRFRLGLPEQDPLILFIGRLNKSKGVDILLQSMVKVAENFSAARLAIIGSGPEESFLRDLSRQLNLSERVTFAGAQDREGVRDYLQACDVVALPSRIGPNRQEEGFPVVMLEALASGRPVVGSHSGGIPEGIEEGRTGFVVPPDDPDALAGALLNVLKQGADTFRDAARESARRFDWQVVGEDYHRTFESVLPPLPR